MNRILAFFSHWRNFFIVTLALLTFFKIRRKFWSRFSLQIKIFARWLKTLSFLMWQNVHSGVLMLLGEIHLDILSIQAMFNPPFKKKTHDPSCHFIDLSYCNFKKCNCLYSAMWSYHSLTQASKVKGFPVVVEISD